MTVSLVAGASGAIGRFLLPRLLAAGHEVIALSRVARTSADPRLRWIVGDLDRAASGLPACDAVFSLGPLDAFARWFAGGAIDGRPRVVAIGSMSLETKRDSPDAGERALAARLDAAERGLRAAAEARGSACTLLRPTLIYGAGLDRSLSPIARFAQRWRVFPRLPAATGLRQPVHADDLAAACLAVAGSARAAGRTYALGGGERLAFDAMLARVQASLPVRTLPLPLPLAPVRGAFALTRAVGLHPPHAAALARLRKDLLADDAAAAADFAWSPRAFRPDAAAWRPAPLPALG
jgi:nucleoside-diphosphate-sugar epimerase